MPNLCLDRRTFLHEVKNKFGLALLFGFSKPLQAFEKLTQIVLKKNKSQIFYSIGFGRKPKYDTLGTATKLLAYPSELIFLNDQQKYFSLKIPFLPHSIIQNPLKPHLISIIPKWGDTVIEYDLETQKVKSKITLKKSQLFFGHGFYHPDGKNIFLSEHHEATLEAYISQWSIERETATRIKNIPTGGGRVHDCQLSLDKKYIIAANSAATQDGMVRPSLAWIGLNTHKIETQVFFELYGPTHFYQTKDGYFIYASGASLPGGEKLRSILGVVSPDKKISPLIIPAEMEPYFLGEALSITASENSKIAYVTLRDTDSVFVFNYVTGNFIKRLSVKVPHGICLSDDHKILFVSSIENHSELYQFNSLSLEPIPFTKTKAQKHSDSNWGAHLYLLRNIY